MSTATLVSRSEASMVVGRGDIASALKGVDTKGKLFFASGVSNVNEKRESEYQREIDLLMEQDKSKHIVYFSSLCIFTSPNTRYSKHKMHMEGLIKRHFPRYTIMRLGNATWGNNPHHLIHFIRTKTKNNEPFKVYDEYRNPMEKQEFLYWVNLIPDWNCEMNITGQLMKIKEVVKKYGFNSSNS